MEKTVMTEGQSATPTLLAIDHAPRSLAVSGEDHVAPPPLLAVQVLPGEVAVQPVEPVTLAHPWRLDPADGRRWLLATDAQEHDVTAAAGCVDDMGGDVWDSWLVLVNGALSSTPLDRLLALVGEHHARPVRPSSWSPTPSPSVASASG